MSRTGTGLQVATDSGTWSGGAVISATGTWWRPFLPLVPGSFAGRQLHAVDYRSAAEFAGQHVVVVGGGNSGAQIAADLTTAAEVTWVTRRPPRYLPDEVDGHALFDAATRRRRAHWIGASPTPAALLRWATSWRCRRSGKPGTPACSPRDPCSPASTRTVPWSDGIRLRVDAVIWCTGFRPALSHLSPLRLRNADGRILTEGTRAVDEPRLHLLGYGDWTGPASATLIGVGMTARAAVADISNRLDG